MPGDAAAPEVSRSIGRVATGNEVVRQEWADGYRRLEAERDEPARYRALHAQLEAITDELRRRVGGVYVLAELADEYRRADSWTQGLLPELPPPARWAPGLAIATDAAFHLYARGARDYEP
jgi:hypothetical protein